MGAFFTIAFLMVLFLCNNIYFQKLTVHRWYYKKLLVMIEMKVLDIPLFNIVLVRFGTLHVYQQQFINILKCSFKLPICKLNYLFIKIYYVTNSMTQEIHLYLKNLKELYENQYNYVVCSIPTEIYINTKVFGNKYCCIKITPLIIAIVKKAPIRF